jgi:hypothetical protein
MLRGELLNALKKTGPQKLSPPRGAVVKKMGKPGNVFCRIENRCKHTGKVCLHTVLV